MQARRAVFAALTCSGLIALALLAGPLYGLLLLERAVPQSNPSSLTAFGLIALAAVAGLMLADAARGVVLARAAAWLDHVPGQLLLEGGLKRAAGFLQQQENARAVDRLRQFMSSAAMAAALDSLWTPLFLAGLFYIQPVMGAIVSIAWLVLAGGFLSQFPGYSSPASKSASQALRRRQHLANEITQAGPLARALGLTQSVAQAWEVTNRGFVAGFYRTAKSASLLRSLSQGVFCLAELSVLAGGALLVIDGQLTAGALVAAILLALRALAPLQRLAGSTGELNEALRAYRHLQQLSALPILPQSNVKPQDEARGEVQLQNVCLSYPRRAEPALCDINLDLAEGECLIVSGAAGSGKTSLAALIAGAVEASAGSVSLDGIALEMWQIADCAPPIGYAPDQPMILDGSVQQNIVRFQDRCLMSAAHGAMKAGVHGLLSDLPQGYDSQVGSHGAALSLRERRAVALARAVHGSPAVIVLDAPEAGLSQGEVKRLASLLEALSREKTTLVIATNDPQLQMIGDKAIVLAGGRIEASGSPDELFVQEDDPPFPVEPWHDPSARLVTFKENADEA